MATYTVATGARGVHDKQLVADTIDIINFADDCRQVDVVWDGTAKGYVTTDGSTPTISGANTDILPAYPCVVTLTSADQGPTTVKLRSAATPTYSVTQNG